MMALQGKERPILYVSLGLNLVLAVLLIFSYTSEPEPQVVAALPETPDSIVSDTQTPEATQTPPPPTQTLSPANTRLPTDMPPPTNTSSPTNTPRPTPTNTPTPTPEPTSTPAPTSTPSPTSVPQPDWLVYLNTFRRMAGVPMVAENIDWSEGSRLHSVYMVNTDHVSHYPNTNSEWYTTRGRLAAENGNIAATVWSGADDTWAINYWMSAPFHGLPILDPELTAVGFGSYLAPIGEIDTEGINFAATLDIQRGLVQSLSDPDSIEFPIFFPPDGGETWVLRHSLYEYPSLTESCLGYSRPTGPPIMIQTGLGDGLPNVSSYSFAENGSPAPACMFHEGTYSNANPTAQQSGRGILNERDAIVIVPQNPLKVGNAYAVTITIDGAAYTSEFTAVDPSE